MRYKMLLPCMLLMAAGCSSLRQAVQNQHCALRPDRPYDVVYVDPERHVIQLFWKDASGSLFGTLEELQEWLAARGDSIIAVTNAGIYEPGYVPTGLFIEEGQEQTPLNLRDGRGNFFLKPNGVFALTGNGAHIVESSRFESIPGPVLYALQSGPLLVSGGVIHPAFRQESESCRLRSGVGVRSDGTVVLVIANGAVNLFNFALFFRDTLECSDALYLDGSISSLYAPSVGRFERSRDRYAGILAVLAKKP